MGFIGNADWTEEVAFRSEHPRLKARAVAKILFAQQLEFTGLRSECSAELGLAQLTHHG